MSLASACRCSVKVTALWKHYQHVVHQIKASNLPPHGLTVWYVQSKLEPSASGVPDVSTHLIERNSRGMCV